MSKKLKKSSWYVYLNGDPLSPSSYHKSALRPLSASGRNICGIYARGQNDKPEQFSPELISAIANAIASGNPQTDGLNNQIVILK